ncbi:N-acetylglucosamine-6-phosphate deacetylase [Yinghuangia seranimata]|uniref:N-acetylglucosamine-6-phosphate deacetylase n=1 Tax=Yinghuangia seranimata TaxID=408067 RepID=UPI00248C0EAF|nr:N-acetylglucosamine-6-phosphate deacetylase [Yinghuangia seranimata]MDI2131202.1 N-acetylglucosamine-6-phosphate deacetylase [Yinghuangia seranimata]
MIRQTRFTGARVVLSSGVLEGGEVAVADGLITAVGGPGSLPETPGATVHDLGGRWLVPGFVDMHVHGGGGASYTAGDADQALRVAAFHRAHGTTTTMASLVTATQDELLRSVSELAGLVEDGVLAGVHLEGPYLSRARCGAHDPDLLREPDRAEVDALLKAGRGTVRMVTLAPELPGGVDLVHRLVDAGVLAAVGHTDGTHRETQAALAAGASVATHLFNAMRSVHHREPGPVTALLQDSDVVVELINDGVHLHPGIVNLAFQAAGSSRVAFITDAMGAAGMPDGTYPLGPMTARVEGGIARLADGDSIAGSTLTLDRALRTAVRENHLPITDVVTALSATPARALGIADKVGSIEAGKQADLIVLDEDLKVDAVLWGGRWVGDGLDA